MGPKRGQTCSSDQLVFLKRKTCPMYLKFLFFRIEIRLQRSKAIFVVIPLKKKKKMQAETETQGGEAFLLKWLLTETGLGPRAQCSVPHTFRSNVTCRPVETNTLWKNSSTWLWA